MFLLGTNSDGAFISKRRNGNTHSKNRWKLVSFPRYYTTYRLKSIKLYQMSDKISFDNRYEGRIGARRGIFPATYVDVSVEPGETRSTLGLFNFILETIQIIIIK